MVVSRGGHLKIMLLANATPGNLILKKYPTFCCSQHRPDVLAPSLALLFFTHLLVFGTISRTISHSAFHRPLQRNVSSPAAGSGQASSPSSSQARSAPARQEASSRYLRQDWIFSLRIWTLAHKYFLRVTTPGLQTRSFRHCQYRLSNWTKPAPNPMHWTEHEATKLTWSHIYIPP